MHRLNQKGIAFIPLIVWGLVAIVAGLTVLQGGYNLAKFVANKNKESVLSATSQSTPVPSPTDTPVPTPIPTQQPVVNNQAQVTGNGPTRTGKIIKYREYCKGGQEISVYENELITKKASDGNTYSMTKDDWICFENAAKNQQLDTNQPSTDDPIITCNSPHEECRIQARKSVCDNGGCCQINGSWVFYASHQQCIQDQQNYAPSLIDCNIDTNCNGQFVTYKYDPSTCISMQTETQSFCQRLNQTRMPQPPQLSFPPVTFPTPAPMIQSQQQPFDAFDTGMMCTRKAINNTAGGGITFIGGCI